MRKTGKDLLGLLFVISLIYGCKTTEQASYPKRPTAVILDFKIENPKLDYATLIFKVEIHNPNAKALSIISMDYSLTSDSGVFLTGTAIESIVLPPHSQEAFTLTDKVIYARLLKSLHCEDTSVAPYQLKLWLRADSPSKKPLELMSKYEGVVSLPDKPEPETD